MYILGVNGSPNEDGNCAFLLNEILSKIEGATTEIVSVNKAVNSAKWPFCVVCSNPCNTSVCPFSNTFLLSATVSHMC